MKEKDKAEYVYIYLLNMFIIYNIFTQKNHFELYLYTITRYLEIKHFLSDHNFIPTKIKDKM